MSSLYTSDDMASIMQRRRQLREAPAPRAGGDLVSEDYYSFSFGDTALGVPRGILSAGSDVVNLALLPFGGEVPDRFNLMDPSATIGGDITSGVTNFLTGFVPGLGIAGKLGKVGRLGKITASVDDAIATSVRAANSARKAGDLVRAANMGRKAARLGALQEITKVTTAGFFADFTVWDGHEQRLSNLLQDYAGLNDPFTSWLAAEDDDTALGELTGRLKNAIEGAGLGLVADGVLSAFKIYRAGYKAKTKGLDPTPYMVKQAREIRVSQEQELKDSFNLTDVEARVTNILIDRMGIDRSRLRIVSGQEALSIYNDATGEMLEQVAVGRRFDSREALKKVLGPEKAENHPFMLLETPELMDSIRSLGGLKKSLDSYQNINTQIETLIAFAKAGAPLQGGYEEGVKAMTEAVGTSRMQMWGLFSAATSPQNIVSAHTELGVYLMVRSAQDAFAGKKMSAKALRDYMAKTLRDDIGYSGAPVSSFTNAKKVYDTVIDRFKEAKKRAEGLNLTDEDILRTIDFEDLVTEIGGDNAMKIRGFAGGSIGSTRLNLALDTWMARLIPDDLVVPQFKDKKRTIKRGGEETTVRTRVMETTLEAKKRWISSKENFVGYAAVIDQVAKRMGLTQTQVQERIWGSVVMLTALKREGVPLEFMLNQMSREDMRSMWDLLSILSNDRIVNELKKIPHKQTKDFLGSASSVFEDIRARVRGGKPDLTREPAELVSAGAETAALEAGIRRIGIGAGHGAHSATLSRRASSGRTWAGPKYDWAAVFRAEQDKFYRKRGLPPAGTPDPTDPRSALLRSSTADRVLGFARFTDDAATIGGLRGANFETAVHELGHVARRFVFDPTVPESVRYGISESDIDAVAKYFGAARDRTGELIWSVNAEEAFTEGLIRYLRTNEPPVPGFAGVFHKVKMWLRNLFNDLDEAGGIDMPADVKAAFSKLLNRGPEDDIAGVTFGRIAPVGSRLLGGPDPEKILFSTSSGATGDWPGGVPSGPLPERLGRPAGNPYGRANWDAFSDSQHVSNYVKQLADDYTDIDDYVPESRAEALEFAQRDYDKLNDIIGERSSVNINEVFDNMATSDLRRITYRLMAMRQLAADTGARIYEIASKGSSAGPDELYEFIRGRRIVEALLYEIRNQQRHIARALNFQGAVMEPNAKRIKLYPTLPKRRDTSLPPGVRQARETVPERVTADPGTREGQGVLFPEAGSDEALADASRPVAAPVTPETAAATPEAPATKVAEAGGPVLDEMESRAQVEAELIGRVIQDAIQSAGGRDAIYADMAKVVAAAANGGVEDAAKFIRRTTRWGQAAMEYWMNSILSGPITHAVNIASNTLVAIMLPIERALGATFRADFATASASLKTYMYMVNNFADAMRMAALSFARDEDILEAGFRKTELEGGRAISATALGMREDSLLGKATEWVGKALNLPSRFLAAEDEFFKQLNYRARFRTELQVEGMKRFPGDHQQAAKWAAETFDRVLEDGQAYTESVVLQRAHKKADTLKITNPAGRNRFVRAYMRDPKNWDPRLGALSRQARDESQYATFTTPLSPDSGPVTSRIAAAVQSAAQQVPAIRFLIPFIRTPTNLLNFAMARTPIANTKYLAELYKTIGKEAADPRRKSDVVGRLVFSAGIGFTAVAAASAGIITGGGPKERDRREMWEATGWRPYSIKIGDKYVSYRRFDPFSTIFGMFADAIETSNEILKNGGDPAEVDQILQTAVVMISRNITNKTYMTGITNFANALSNPKQFGQQFVNSFAASSVPYSSLLGQSIGLFSDDPAMRELESAMDAIKSRIPGLEATVPPRRNLFGEEILKNKRGLAASVGLADENNSVYSAISTFSPFEYAEETTDELATEFRNLNHPFDRPNPIRGRNLDLREFKTDEGQQAYDRWLQLHGEVKIGGLTLRKYLTRLIRSKRYQNLSPVSTDEYQSPRVRLLRAAISRFREAAFNRLLKESTILRETYKIDFANRQALLSGRRADELVSLIR